VADPPAIDQFLGVAVGNVQLTPRVQRHIALIYRESIAAQARLSHLMWHNTFVDEVWRPRYHWQEIQSIDVFTRVAVVGFLLKLANSRPIIPYGFSRRGCTFQIDPATGRMAIHRARSGVGVTCSTFICLVFESLGIELVAEATWPSDRPDDAQWRERMLQALAQRGEETAHIQAMSRVTFDARLRPEEIAAATIQYPWPRSFDDVAQMAEEIAVELGDSTI
jgi:hypothetical protein